MRKSDYVTIDYIAVGGRLLSFLFPQSKKNNTIGINLIPYFLRVVLNSSNLFTLFTF